MSALARAFARAVQHEMDPGSRRDSADLGNLDELRGTVQAYVAGLKAAGAPPERVVVAVKAATASGALLAWHSHEDWREATALTEQVVRWCVQAYYAGEAS